MKLEVMNKLKTTFMKTKVSLKKHSPEIFIACGITGVVVSAVLACVATTKVKDVTDNAKRKIEDVHKKEVENKESYSKKEVSKDLTHIYFSTGVKLLGLYAPSIVLGGLSLTGIIASNNILRKRSVALAAAYATVDKSFKEYRNRVVERFGSEVDNELRYDIHQSKVTETITDAESGKEKKVKKDVKRTGYDGVSDYARIFDGQNPNYRNDNDYNLYFLRQQQAFFNDKLIVDGFVYLNDVYEALGYPKTMAGQVVGWIYKKDVNNRGDNYIDFGINEVCTSDPDANVVDYGYLLDFNVDGEILTYAHEE